jgi:hypothetical protein
MFYFHCKYVIKNKAIILKNSIAMKYKNSVAMKYKNLNNCGFTCFIYVTYTVLSKNSIPSKIGVVYNMCIVH